MKSLYCAVFAAFGLKLCIAQAVASGSFTDGGIYSGPAAAGNMVHQKVSREGMLADASPQIENSAAKGKKLVLQLPLLDPDSPTDRELLENWVKNTPLEKVWLIHFGEENIVSSRPQLQALREIVRAASKVPVYDWYSMPLDPAGSPDGFWYDFYEKDGTSLREMVRKYLATGLPLGITVDGSRFSSLEFAREQVLVCREFDLPVQYFVAESHRTGSYNGWYEAGAFLAPARNFVFSALELQRRSGEPYSLKARDFFWGDLIELWPTSDGMIDFSWSGVECATVYGFTRLNVQGGEVKLNEEKHGGAALDFHFWSHFPVKDATLKLDSLGPADGLRVEVSRSGLAGTWSEVKSGGGESTFSLGSPGREFRLRIQFSKLDAGFRSVQLIGRADIMERTIELFPAFFDGWRKRIDFQQNLNSGSWQALGDIVQGSETIDTGKSFSLTGIDGIRTVLEVVEHFRSQEPLENLQIRAFGRENPGNFGGRFEVGVSLDGSEVLIWGKPDDKREQPGGWIHVGKTLNLSDQEEFQEAREFYVHLRLTNDSGIAAKVGSEIERLEITANIHDEK